MVLKIERIAYTWEYSTHGLFVYNFIYTKRLFICEPVKKKKMAEVVVVEKNTPVVTSLKFTIMCPVFFYEKGKSDFCRKIKTEVVLDSDANLAKAKNDIR